MPGAKEYLEKVCELKEGGKKTNQYDDTHMTALDVSPPTVPSSLLYKVTGTFKKPK